MIVHGFEDFLQMLIYFLQECERFWFFSLVLYKLLSSSCPVCVHFLNSVGSTTILHVRDRHWHNLRPNSSLGAHEVTLQINILIHLLDQHFDTPGGYEVTFSTFWCSWWPWDYLPDQHCDTTSGYKVTFQNNILLHLVLLLLRFNTKCNAYFGIS